MRHSKSIWAVFAIVSAAGIMLASTGNAQMKVEITPFAGYYIASDLYTSYATAGGQTGQVELTNSALYGGRLTMGSDRGAIEFAYTRAGSDVKIQRALSGQPRQDIGRMDIDGFDLNFIGYQRVANPRVYPFGSIGFGWSVTHPTVDSDFVTAGVQPEGRTLFNFNFAVGVKYELSPKLSTRIEGRWRVTDTNITTDAGVWCDPWGYCYSYASDWYNSGELIGGLSYSFR
jgi:hypothetical protein